MNLNTAFKNCRAFTLAEVLVSMAIMATLASILFVSYGSFIKRADRVACTGNLRTLHVAFSAYVHDQGHWPQRPEDLPADDVKFYKWIIKEVTPYGGGLPAWMCPAERRERVVILDPEDFVGSYVPTLFDSNQNTPWKWAKQPWLIERASNHKDGPLLILPDSSVHTVNEATVLY